jgi:hypothetical protein
MRTHLEFTSSAFPAYPDEDKEINPAEKQVSDLDY